VQDRKVVDASVAVKWYVPEVFEVEASRLLDIDAELHAPELIIPEFSSIIWEKIRQKEITENQGQRIVNAFLKTDMKLHSHRKLMRSAFTGAAISGQTVYDWTYLSLAMSLSCEFVTADERFYNALRSTSLVKHLAWIGDI
jgi:predicted nucleic acid-binding protein